MSRSLSNSWASNEEAEADEGAISWAEDTDDSVEEAPVQYRRSPHNKGRRTPERPGRSKQAASSAAEPGFVMPAVDSASPRSQAISSSHRYMSTTADQTRARQDLRYRTAPKRISAPIRPSERAPSKHGIVSVSVQVTEYVLDILGSALKVLKQPIAWLVALYLFAGIIVLLQNFVTSSISAAFSPICRVPGVSYLGLSVCSYSPRYSVPQDLDDDVLTIQSASASRKPKTKSKAVKGGEPEFETLMNVQSQFDSILSDTTSQSALTLPVDMKRSEASIRDLRQIVRFSTINSKNELLHEFDGFIETARAASFDLQKFNSQVGRAVDIVLSTAKWTGRVLNDIAAHKESRGLIPAFVQDTLLAPFQPIQFNEARVLEQYILHSRLVSDEITRLTSEAQGILMILSNLEERLDAIHQVSLRDNMAARADRDEILSHLWTFFGGNRKKLDHVDTQLHMLARVSEYRKMAFAHVSSTVIKLQAMSAELDELRSRVGAVEIERDSGLPRVPLDVHLEAIKLGVERLEFHRDRAKEIRQGYTRRLVDSSSGSSSSSNDAGRQHDNNDKPGVGTGAGDDSDMRMIGN